ncbi:FadR/GntR family transcriptional regulator [Rhodoglobus sp.]
MPKTPGDRASFTVLPIANGQVYNSVLQRLVSYLETLESGDRLPSERALSEEFSVSRVSLREALRSLESMGRIEIRRNSGSFVREPRSNPMTDYLRRVTPSGEASLNQLVDVRAALEDRVVLLAGSEPRDYSAVRSHLAEVESEITDAAPSGSLDVRFEALLARLTQNRLLIEFQRTTHELWIETWASCGRAPGDRSALLVEHREILDALETGDTALARVRMAAHVDRNAL